MELEFLSSLFVWFGGSRAVAFLVAMLVDAGKRIGLVKDGQAGKFAAGLNLAALVGLAVYVSQSGASFESLEAQLGQVGQLAAFVMAYAYALRASPSDHDEGVWAGSPLFYRYPSADAKF